MLTAEQARSLLAEADLIVSADEVAKGVARVARDVTAQLAASHPLVLSVMGGAVVFTGNLLPQLSFPLDFDYLHVSRYGAGTEGGQLRWITTPRQDISGRVVLVVDDILDEGVTLQAIREHLMAAGARECYCAVFADKQIAKPKPIAADFVGVTLPDRFVFGYGMDIDGAWRNLPAVYALKNTQ